MRSFENIQKTETDRRDDLLSDIYYWKLAYAKNIFSDMTDCAKKIERFSGLIDDKSTSNFIGAFSSDISEIKDYFETFKPLLEDISELHNDSASNSTEKEPKSQSEHINVSIDKIKIKSELLEISGNLINSINETEKAIRMIDKNNSNIASAYEKISGLKKTIDKLDDIKAKIDSYSGRK